MVRLRYLLFILLSVGCASESPSGRTVEALGREVDELEDRLTVVEEQVGVATGDTLLQVAAEALNIREGPSTEDRILATARRGTHLRKLGCALGDCSWFSVEYRVGPFPYTGFVSGRDDFTEEVIVSAETFLSRLHDSRITVNWEDEVQDALSASDIEFLGVWIEGIGVGDATALVHVHDLVDPTGIRIRPLDSDPARTDLGEACLEYGVGAVLTLRFTEGERDNVFLVRLDDCEGELLDIHELPVSATQWGR